MRPQDGDLRFKPRQFRLRAHHAVLATQLEPDLRRRRPAMGEGLQQREQIGRDQVEGLLPEGVNHSRRRRRVRTSVEGIVEPPLHPLAGCPPGARQELKEVEQPEHSVPDLPIAAHGPSLFVVPQVDDGRHAVRVGSPDGVMRQCKQEVRRVGRRARPVASAGPGNRLLQVRKLGQPIFRQGPRRSGLEAGAHVPPPAFGSYRRARTVQRTPRASRPPARASSGNAQANEGKTPSRSGRAARPRPSDCRALPEPRSPRCRRSRTPSFRLPLPSRRSRSATTRGSPPGRAPSA